MRLQEVLAEAGATVAARRQALWSRPSSSSRSNTTRSGCSQVVRTIRPDTVFIPYHWPDKQSANQLTHRTIDPRSKIPEFKVSACRLEKVQA